MAQHTPSEQRRMPRKFCGASICPRWIFRTGTQRFPCLRLRCYLGGPGGNLQ
ncbi:Hypothetical predicted protein [Pelobates cultripes]|uniref:Uncharacterized protein n=1 Tax=Pelobates cultripes TaxID=61616 RepID=A0AAD1TI32_PELCU|nr:Hypothetical predicted protein [Pelobates cultripes]